MRTILLTFLLLVAGCAAPSPRPTPLARAINASESYGFTVALEFPPGEPTDYVLYVDDGDTHHIVWGVAGEPRAWVTIPREKLPNKVGPTARWWITGQGHPRVTDWWVER